MTSCLLSCKPSRLWKWIDSKMKEFASLETVSISHNPAQPTIHVESFQQSRKESNCFLYGKRKAQWTRLSERFFFKKKKLEPFKRVERSQQKATSKLEIA